MSEIKLIVRPFAMGTEKEAALKPLEEASEVRAAWQKIDECGIPEQCRDCDLHNTCEAIFALADEIADTIQASCNLAARYNINLQAAIERCEKRNRERGRYEDAKSCGIHDGDNHGCGGDCGVVPVGMDVLREKTPEEMSFKELFETLSFAIDNHSSVSDCRKIIGLKWCEGNYDCRTCRKRLLDLLETAYKQEKEGLRCEEFYLAEECTKRDKEIEGLKREIADLTHERDGLRKKQVSKDEHCGSRRSDRRNHGVDCGAKCVGKHLLPVKPPAQEISEREKVLERLREIDFTQKNVSLSNIGRAVLGYGPNPWWDNESRAALRDKLIEMLGGVNDAG